MFLSSIYAGAFNASADLRIPRLDGVVFRLGTAILQSLHKETKLLIHINTLSREILLGIYCINQDKSLIYFLVYTVFWLKNMTHNASSEDIVSKLFACSQEIDALFKQIISNQLRQYEIYRPSLLIEAMQYSCIGAGKRLRPFLVLKSAEIFSGDIHTALRVGCAVEAIHCYSLIHDDLPAMDDDDLRRGKPSLHRKYDEATAILAGDALLTLAFDIIASEHTELKAETKLKLIQQLSQAAGVGGMVGGQILDLKNENRAATDTEILKMHSMKTGAILTFSARAGAIISDASEQDIKHLESYGAAIGLAFQLADDILDLTVDSKTLGKTSGKDLTASKATIATLYGIDETKRQLNGLIDEAIDILSPYKEKANELVTLARFVRDRNF